MSIKYSLIYVYKNKNKRQQKNLKINKIWSGQVLFILPILAIYNCWEKELNIVEKVVYIINVEPTI